MRFGRKRAGGSRCGSSAGSGRGDQFLADVQLAQRLGAPQLLLWESDYIGLPPAQGPLVKAMSDYVGK